MVVGISDNTTRMFTSAWFTRLHTTIARVGVEWNAAVLKDPTALNSARTWIRAAEAAGVKPLVSFTPDGGSAGNYVPSTAVYTQAIKAFIHDVPEVKLYTPWNEPDWIYRPALAQHPALAASYFNALVANCPGCTVGAGELYRPASDGLGAWIQAYARALRSKPKAWALHPYDDVRTHTTSQIQTLARYTTGSIWLTEISGVIRRGHWRYGPQSPAAAARDEAFLFGLPRHFPRITSIYHYQWQGTVDTPQTGWDSGLIGPNGVPRPAYQVVYNAAQGKLP